MSAISVAGLAALAALAGALLAARQPDTGTPAVAAVDVAAEAAASMLSRLPGNRVIGASASHGDAAGVVVAGEVAPGATSVQVTANAVLAAAASQAQHAAMTEADVARRRRKGESESAIYQLRMAQLPAADVEQLMAMERAEAAWRGRVEALRAECGGRAECVTAEGAGEAPQGSLAAYQAPGLVRRMD